MDPSIANTREPPPKPTHVEFVTVSVIMGAGVVVLLAAIYIFRSR
jgi:hypothetical protein